MLRNGNPKRPRRLVAKCVALALLLELVSPVRAQDREFPFDRELMLDAKPMRGSKRVPTFEIGPTGETEIDLWCGRASAQMVVVENTITVIVGEKTADNCTPEQARQDEDMLAALAQVTAWRRDGDLVILVGPKTLRLKLPTN